MNIHTNVYLLEASKGSYVYLVMGEEPVLIDTGMPGRADRIVSELQELGLKPTDIAHILLTHHDVDHIGNAKFLQERSGAKLWAPERDLPYIHGTEKRQGLKRVISTLVRAESPAVDAVYVAGQKLGDLEVIPTPGHTPGHVSILYRDTLFAGDLVTSRKGNLKATPGFLNWNKVELKHSIRAVGKLSFDWVCPAHGDPVQRGNLWEAMLS